jgi:hypothetical protein
MKTMRLAALSVFSLLSLLSIQAAEYHVAPGVQGAADDNPGTLAKPWKTIARAAATAQAGNTVLIHAGTYPESVTIKNAGTADKPIVFQAFGDDKVILEGADPFGADKWQLAPNARNIFAAALDRDPGQLFVDGKAVYPKVDQTRKVYPRTYKLGVLTDADKNFYQYDAKAKRLLLALADSPARHDTTDHVFAHNLVRDCNPAIWLAIEHPNFADYNTYWPGKNAPIAWGEAPKGERPLQYKDLADWVKATGHDLHSQVKDAQPADVGLDTVTFRVDDAKDPKQVLMMVGNGGCEYEDPAGQNILPYFWRAGSGDGAEHKFPYAAYCSLKGGTEALAYGGAGGTVAFPLDSQSDPKQPKFAHGGLRYLKIDGQKPAAMCKQGLGFWSPSLPARVGDTYDISFFVRGMELKPTGAAAIAAFVEFTDATGQHEQGVALPTGTVSDKPLTGTFDWTKLAAEVKVPDGAKRMRVFIGLLPALGQLLLDDVSVKVR